VPYAQLNRNPVSKICSGLRWLYVQPISIRLRIFDALPAEHLATNDGGLQNQYSQANVQAEEMALDHNGITGEAVAAYTYGELWEPLTAKDPAKHAHSAIVVPEGKDSQSRFPGCILDERKRLSECQIWQMLYDVYATGGTALWEQIPYHITNNRILADTYAELILSFLIDSIEILDKNEPVYIIEMGAGTGCLSFYLIKELTRKSKLLSQIADIKIKYVMCEFSGTNISDWLNKEEFKPFLNNGSMEFAIFKPEEQSEITTFSGTRIAADTVNNPVFAIGNYFFDSLKQDAFRIHNGRLEEVLHTFYFDESQNGGTERTFEVLQKSESYAEVPNNYYANPLLNSLLKSYEQQFENASFFLPVGAFNCIDNLKALSGSKLVLLATDKGHVNAAYFDGLYELPFFAHDGIFSYSVNFDAIARYFSLLGGFSLNSDAAGFAVETQLCILHEKVDLDALPLTHHRFTEDVSRKNSVNYLYYAQHLLTLPNISTKLELLRAYIGLVRASNCDPVILHLCAELVANTVSEANAELRRNLSDMLKEVEENVFRVRMKTDAINSVGRIHYMLGNYDACIRAMEKSCAEFGEKPITLYYLAACFEMKQDYVRALTYYGRGFVLKPTCDSTRQAVQRMATKVDSGW
jgi:hypothetical protein